MIHRARLRFGRAAAGLLVLFGLLAGSPVMAVTLSGLITSGPTPVPAVIGQDILTGLSAVVLDPPRANEELQVQGPLWYWEIVKVENAPSAAGPWTQQQTSGYTATLSTQPDSPNAVLTTRFQSAASWRVTLRVTAAYTVDGVAENAAATLVVNGLNVSSEAPATIDGTIKDPNGVLLSGQIVRLKRGGETLQRQDTGADGAFAFTPLAPGTYEVDVEAQPADQRDNPDPQTATVAAGERKTLQFSTKEEGGGGGGVQVLVRWNVNENMPSAAEWRVAGMGGDDTVAGAALIIVYGPLVTEVTSVRVREAEGHTSPWLYNGGAAFDRVTTNEQDYPFLPAGTTVWVCGWITEYYYHNSAYSVEVDYLAGSAGGQVRGTASTSVQLRNYSVQAVYDDDCRPVFQWDSADPDGLNGRTKRMYHLIVRGAKRCRLPLGLFVYPLCRSVEAASASIGPYLDYQQFVVDLPGDWRKVVHVRGEWSYAAPAGPPGEGALPSGLYPWTVYLQAPDYHCTTSFWGVQLFSPSASQAEFKGRTDDGAWQFAVSYTLTSAQIDDDGSGRNDDDQPEVGLGLGRLTVYDPDFETVELALDDLPCELHGGQCDGRLGPAKNHKLLITLPDSFMHKAGRYHFAITPTLDVHGKGHRDHGCRPALAMGQSFQHIDLDVDSDNNNGFDDPDCSPAEDDLEHTADDAHPGKVILVQNGDLDHDGIPDCFDGYNLDQRLEADGSCAGLKFAPLVLHTKGMRPTTVVRLSYSASDPMAVTASATEPWVMPQDGQARLWLKNGDAPRSGQGVRDGGDYVPPGDYTAAELGLIESEQKVFYIEAVRPSQSVGDLQFAVQMDPPGGATDAVRLTATGVALERLVPSPAGDASWEQVYRMAGSYLNVQKTGEDDDDLVPLDVTPGAYESSRLVVYDPRLSLAACRVGSQDLALARGSDGLWRSDAYTALGSDPEGAPPPLLSLRPLGSPYDQWYTSLGPRFQIPTPEVDSEYNPSKWWPSRDPGKCTRADRIVADLTKQKIRELHDAEALPPTDTTFNWLGCEAEAAVTGRLSGRRGWLTDVVVDLKSMEILGIAGSAQGNAATHVQVDILKVDWRYKPAVGDKLDVSRIQELYEIKNSVDGKVPESQARKLKKLLGRDFKSVCGTEWRVSFAGGTAHWESNKRWKVAVKVLDVLALATTAYNMINYSSYDEEFEAIMRVAQNIAVHTDGDPDDRRLRVATELIPPMKDYLAHFDATGGTMDIAFTMAACQIVFLSDPRNG